MTARTLDLTFVELFAGVGGMSMGLEDAGWDCCLHAEWDPFPRRVLQARWPLTPLFGDVSALSGYDLVAEVGPFTLLTFGAPCQDFSIAGKRDGMDGTRSVLVLDALRIWEESGAPLALYENVVGMLSSNQGEDFASILSVFVGDPVAVPARGWKGGGGVVRGRRGVAAWRVLDSRYFGLPQKRRRCFVVGSRDPRFDPAQILSLVESQPRHPAPRTQATHRSAADAGASASLTFDARGNGTGTTVNALTGDHNNRVTDYTALVVEPHTDALAPRVGARDGKGPGSYLNGQLQGSVVVRGRVRRLLPVECERLMGWPAGWTDVPDEKGRPASDTARYKACGNGVASPVAAWIGFRLRAAVEGKDPDAYAHVDHPSARTV